jgi:hypothetical protein
VATEIQLPTCGYPACRSVRRCEPRGSVLARFADAQDRPLRQRKTVQPARGLAQRKQAERVRHEE